MSREEAPRQAGLTLIELMIAMTLGLLVAIAVYDLVSSSGQTWRTQSDLAQAQATGRSTIELMTIDLRHAGFSPAGASYLSVPQGSAESIRLLSDLDGDSVVGAAGETGECISYLFTGPSADGHWELRRGVDLDGDGDFTGSGESVDTIATRVKQVDANGDGTLEAFLTYDGAPPATSRVTVTFGIESTWRDPLTKQYALVTFRDSVSLRNLD